MSGLVAATSKGECDAALQRLSRAILDTREQINVLHAWRAPLLPEEVTDLGYTPEQEVDLSAFISVSKMWVDLIGVGGTISAANGEMFERLLVAIYGLGGQAGIVTAPPPEEPA